MPKLRKPLRIDHHVVLLDEAADARDFRDAFGLGKAVAHVPVLQRAQFGERAVLRQQRVLVDPADPGRIGAERRRDAIGEAARGAIEIFEHARARPIDVGAVLEDHIDERDPEIREAAHHARLRHGEHRGRQRIGDLILDHLRRLAGIFGVDDDLRIGEVGDRIQRQMKDRIESRRDGEHRADHHEHDVARGRGDQARDHCGAPASLRPLSAAFRLLSASIRKLAEVTTDSPSFTPSRIST